MTNKLLLIFLRGLPLNCETREAQWWSKAGAKGEGEQGGGQPGPGTCMEAGSQQEWCCRCGARGRGWDCRKSGGAFRHRPFRRLLNESVSGCWWDESHGGENRLVLPSGEKMGVKKVHGFFWQVSYSTVWVSFFPSFSSSLSLLNAMHRDLFSFYINYAPLNYTPESAWLHRHSQKGPCMLQSAYYVCIFNLKEK